MNNWISVKSRLPEAYTEVILYTQDRNIVMGQYMFHNTFASPWLYPVLGQCKVTHWMPLPEPPKEEINNLQEPITLAEADEQCFYDERDKE